MAQKLLIVESPTKARTFQKYLGRGYVIKASKGHVVDLPKSKLGIDVENGFEPQYVTIRGKGKVIKELEQAARNVDEVLLATDPDREGEAIAWHLQQHLEKRQPNIRRILLNEITKEAIAEAVEKPGEVDLRKVEAQQARRVLDRLVGYQISPLLWKIFYYGLSAGRVQSVALRLIVERERERRAFVSEEYWSLRAEFTGAAGVPFEGRLFKIRGEDPQLADVASMRALLAGLGAKDASGDDALAGGELRVAASGTPPFTVTAVERSKRKRSPEPPYITSTLQRDASSKLGFSARRTMMLAQQLYEGVDIAEEGAVGLITYMRTDSTRIADSARAEHRDFVQKTFGADYLPAKDRQFKVKRGAQDAHEAIRPTRVSRVPDGLRGTLTKDQLALYRLIWQRFVASLMAEAQFEATRVDVTAGDALFRATGNRLLFDGYRRASGPLRGKPGEAAESGSENGDGERLLPVIEEGERLDAALIPRQHFTEPPPRYSESSLIKELEERGIGRPSTYANIVGTIQGRDYLTLDDNRRFQPTELGEGVWQVLEEGFPRLFEVGFTARMEEELDKVEEGDEVWTDVVDHFYAPMRVALSDVSGNTEHLRESIREETGEACEKCGKPMIKTWGRNGRFLACSGYPECRNSRPLEAPEEAGEQKCPECGAQMMVRVGRFGRFAACSRYPDCKGTAPLQIGVPCPREDCNGQLVEKRSKRGRTFYGCNSYPDCDFASWSRPVATPCPDCGGMVVEKASKAKGNYQQCSVCKLEIPE
ncbi:type I DNA topoisomerase [bacterium]|nr:type I DNA topoisomerase [bacterium]